MSFIYKKANLLIMMGNREGWDSIGRSNNIEWRPLVWQMMILSPTPSLEFFLIYIWKPDIEIKITVWWEGTIF